jgi:hypothetical protein
LIHITCGTSAEHTGEEPVARLIAPTSKKISKNFE